MLRRRSTPAGQHRPVLLAEVLEALDPQPGMVAVDCTVGRAGHAAEMLKRIGPQGRLIGLDLDADNLVHAKERLEEIGHPFTLHHANLAGLAQILSVEGIAGVDGLLADLGMSSMQVDDPERGFSYVRDGPLDMRMDQSRGRTASEILATIPEEKLRHALQELGDEPDADKIARAIVAARPNGALKRTTDLTRIVMAATQTTAWRLHPKRDKWVLHPAARTFQALRILVNRELANLQQLLRLLPTCLNPGGRAAIISFHSGEDRLVKTAFRDGLREGVYQSVSDEPARAGWSERAENPRSRSAKLRWAQLKSDEPGA
jgi:16S rRNA (cytosine1402-N4)-methyltransferase